MYSNCYFFASKRMKSHSFTNKSLCFSRISRRYEFSDFPSSSYPTDFSDIDRSNEWSELKGAENGRIAVGELGNWSGGGFGLKLMQKMGYKLGEVRYSPSDYQPKNDIPTSNI